MSNEQEKDCESSDDEDLVNIFFLHHACKTLNNKKKKKKKRRWRPRWIHKRLNWAEHLRKLHHEQAFDRTYRMSFNAFCRLLDLLRDDLITMTVLQHGGYHDADAVEPELIAAIGIRWLAGGSYVDI